MNKRKIRKAIKRIKYLPRNKYLFKYLGNKLKHFYYKATKSKKVAYPSTIMLELTNHCNLHCTTCPREYDYGKKMDKGKMQISQAKTVIDELWPYIDSIGLTGMGETFLYKDIEEIVDYIKSKNKGIIISVSTNAMLPDFIDIVKPIVDKIDTIQISIDGLGEKYEKIRIGASFNALQENLKSLSDLCKNSETTLMLNMVVTKENYTCMAPLVRFSEDINIEFLDFTLFNLASVTKIDRNYYQFYKSEEFKIALKELDRVADSSDFVTVTNRNFSTDNSFQKCPFPWTHFYICWNGFVTPCCAKPFPKECNFGNVFESGVMNILNGKKIQAWRQLWFNNETPKFCDKCHFIDIEPVAAGA
ncbi:radical SAM protein [Natronoflexus pectinivorans]|uniref:Radical SAM protein with 4Fe4S-binding SPASM domain n=1 Tax=Natronoflexus pectinivorans TaxID=682526 RepID=A0A4R2GN94_9BACT|nr:radical SAM protein [Natronoflexus pectinivorans]TCO09165.1 radical SAM protein with 4Fe4S-binding SPASM domain [Natronoflexus pectinivorans]